MNLASLKDGNLSSLISVKRENKEENEEKPPAFRFYGIGDWGAQTSEASAVAQQMEAHHQNKPVQAVCSFGDNSYPNGDINATYQDQFLSRYPSLTRKYHPAPGKKAGKTDEKKVAKTGNEVDWIVTLGNHDCREPQYLQDQLECFRMPGKHYVWKGPGIDFFVLNTNTGTDNTGFDQDEKQQSWLDKALSQSKARWKIVMGHHPVYTSYKKKLEKPKDRDPDLVDTLQPLLKKHKADFYVSGHQHCYERFKPMDGVRHVTSGGGGHRLNKTLEEAGQSSSPHPDSECFVLDHHFLAFKLRSNTLTLKAYTRDGTRIDKLKVEKNTA